MSAVITRDPISVIAAPENNNQLRFEALCRLVEYSQGTFSFAPVQFDLPSLQNEVLGRLHERFPDLNLVTVKLTPPPPDVPRAYHVLDQLRDLVKFESPDRAPDALIITGYESLFPEAVKADDGRITDELVRAIQPLNLGRNLFAEAFPCPVLLCLPPTAMGVFLRSAPDLVSWKSGFFKFESDPETIRAELEREAGKPMNRLTRWQLGRRAPEELFAETKRFEALIADGEAMPAGYLPDANRLIARLYHRLGWTAVALKDRLQARGAFAEMLRRAKEAADQRSIGAAERGQCAAEAITTVARLSPTQSAAVQEVFRGAVALTEAEGLYGREDELRELVSRVTSVNTRFLTIWGETGCGKTSLVLAGLLSELNQQGHYLSVIVRQWEEPESAIRHALAQTSGIALDSFEMLHGCISHVAQQTQKTVVVACDQFEQFFTAHPQRSIRQSLIKTVSACVNDLRIPCKLLFILREDHLGRMVEFESHVPEAIEQRKRFYLPLFSAANAARVLRLQADKAKLDWPEVFVQTIVRDLTRDGRVRPIDLQLVGAALVASGISNELEFARRGKAVGLMADYLQLALDKLGQGERSIDMIKRVLLSLVVEPGVRLALTPEEIAAHTGIKLTTVRQLLKQLSAAHLVCNVHEPLSFVQTVNESSKRYELIHDALIIMVLTLTRDLHHSQRHAARILTRALEDLSVNPRHIIGLDKLGIVGTHCDRATLAGQKVKSLLRRSFIAGWSKRIVITYLVVSMAIIIMSFTTYTRIEMGRTLLDIGLTDYSVTFHLKSLKDVDPFVQINAIRELGRLARTDPQIANRIVEPLFSIIQIDNREVGLVAASALGQAVQADPPLITHVLQRLIAIISDDDDKDGAAVLALAEVAKAEPKGSLQALLASLKSKSSKMREAASSAIGQAVQVDPSLSDQAIPPLLSALSDNDLKAKESAVIAIGRAVEIDQSIAAQVLPPLALLLKEGNEPAYNAFAAALRQFALANPDTSFKPLFVALSDKNDLVKSAAASALMQVAETNPKDILQPLLFALKDNNLVVRGNAALALGEAASIDQSLVDRV